MTDAHAAQRAPVCRLCGATLQDTVVDLGAQPPCEAFLTAEQRTEPELTYPLHAMVCRVCFLVQTSIVVPPTEVFTEYAYHSSYAESWVEHARRFATEAMTRLGLGSAQTVVEVGSNDGYLLQHFAQSGVEVLGVDPAANVAEVARSRGVPTEVAFFGLGVAQDLRSRGVVADLVCANNVLAQVPDLHGLVAGIAHLLAPTGVLTIEVPHLARLVDEGQFDTIYHEHYSYFSLTTLERVLGDHGMTVVDVERLATHGGSIRAWVAHQASEQPVHRRVASLRAEEQASGLQTLEYYAAFAERVARIKHDLLAFLIEARRQSKVVVGYGAPGKGNTLLNACGIDTDLIPFLVDRNPYKHGRFSPGAHLPIYPTERVDQMRPDYLLIMPWNLRTEIEQSMAHVAEWGAKMLVAVPHLEVIAPAGNWKRE